MRSLAVVGGGVIGLAIAARAADQGWVVTVHDPAPARGASWVAGGMLAPLSESWPGEDAVLGFGAAALERWPGFARWLGRDDLFTATTTLTVALDTADIADLREMPILADFLANKGDELRDLAVDAILKFAAARALSGSIAASTST